MKRATVTPEEAKANIMKTLENPCMLSFATMGANGYPNLRCLMLCDHDGIDTLWFGTNSNADKIKELQANPKATVYNYSLESMGEFRLHGDCKIVSDAASRHRIWKDEFLHHFPEGVDSPDLVVIQFIVKGGTWGDMSKSGTF